MAYFVSLEGPACVLRHSVGMDASSSLEARFAPLLVSLRESGNPDAAGIGQRLEEMISVASPSSTMAQWCRGYHGQTVRTIQIDNHSGAVWIPEERVLDAESYATKALFGGSAREYAGMRVLAARGDALIAADDWHTVAYLV